MRWMGCARQHLRRSAETLRTAPRRITGNWQLATGNWQLATGNWQLATGNWQLATGNWQLATGNSISGLRMHDFISAIADEHVYLFDGAMGTMLYSKGVFINKCYDELNLISPEIVLAVH